jgi:hypothetical protein
MHTNHTPPARRSSVTVRARPRPGGRRGWRNTDSPAGNEAGSVGGVRLWGVRLHALPKSASYSKAGRGVRLPVIPSPREVAA